MKWFSAMARPLSPASCSLRSPTGLAGCRSRARRWPSFCCCGPWGGSPSCFSAHFDAKIAALLDLAFPSVFVCVVAREILAGRNWRNLPMLGALTLLLAGNLLVHLDAVGAAVTAELGNRLGVATLLMLISFVGGRIVPSFTRNWLAKQRPEISAPATFDVVDRAVLAIVALALVVWVCAPHSPIAPWTELAAGLAVGLRLARWRGQATLREPLLWILHLGYGWMAVGFILLAINGLAPLLPSTTALHALTAGTIGTMTLAVMTRASLGHTGRPLVAGRGTTTIYVLVTLAALLRLLAPLGGTHYVLLLSAAGAAWSGAFGLFALLYAHPLALPRVKDGTARPICPRPALWVALDQIEETCRGPETSWKKWPLQRCHLIWIKAS